MKKMNKKYNIIYADPPWKYKDKAKAGKRGVEFQYPTMDKTEIITLDINEIAAKDCALFLWVTAPQLPVGLEVMKAWGFEYKTIAFNWVKKNKIADSWFWGMGHYTRSNAEQCLLGMKGRLKRQSAAVHSIVDTSI